MAPRIIDDPLTQQRAEQRLELVVKRDIRPIKEIKPWMWKALFAITILDLKSEDAAEYLGISKKSVTVYLEQIALAMINSYSHFALMQSIRRYYNIQLGRDIAAGVEDQY